MFSYFKNILLFSFIFTSSVYACVRGENCFVPQANAGNDKTYYIGSTVILDGSMSIDPEGEALTYLWSSEYFDSDLSGINPSFTLNNIAQTITISLIVNDGDYNSYPDEVIITVVDSNDHPVIDVQTSFTVNKNSEFVIDASMTQDDNSQTGIISFTWIDESGAFDCTQNDNGSVLTCLAPDINSDDTFIIDLSVTDGESSDSESISIFVLANRKPVSIPGQDQLVKLGTQFVLDGSQSYDPEGLGLTYLWNIPPGFSLINGTLNDAQITVEYDGDDIPENNNHIFSLIVNDGIDNSNEFNGEDIFISEYCDHPDNANTRYIEIYNPTSQTINLGDGNGYCMVLFSDDYFDNQADCESPDNGFCLEDENDFVEEYNTQESCLVFGECVIEDYPSSPSIDLDDYEFADYVNDENGCLGQAGVCVKQKILDDDGNEISAVFDSVLDDYESNRAECVELDFGDEFRTIFVQAEFNREYTWGTNYWKKGYEIWRLNNGGDWVYDDDDLEGILETRLSFNDLIVNCEELEEEDCVESENVNSIIYDYGSIEIECEWDEDGGPDQQGLCVYSGDLDANYTSILLEPQKSIAITRKNELTNSAQYIDFENIDFINWELLSPGGDDAVGLAFDGQLIDVIGGTIDPGQGWSVAGFSLATRDAQIIRKDNVLGGNISEDCLTYNSGGVETLSCWELSAGTNEENSEWVYYEDKDDENPLIPDVDSFSNAGFHYCATCYNYLTVTLTDNEPPTALLSSDFIYDGVNEYWSPFWDALEGSTIMLDASLSLDPEGADLMYSWTSENVQFSDPNIVNPSIIVPSLSEIIINLLVNDGVNPDSINIKIDVVSENTEPEPIAEFSSMVFDDSIADEEGLDEFFEGHTVTFSALSSFDNTFTGNLSYSWSINPPDIDLIDSETAMVSFVAPNYIGEDKDYTLTLIVSDGLLESFVEKEFIIEARMPIIGIEDTEIDGNENSFIKLDASLTTNPNGSFEDLNFSWTPSFLISGYCSEDSAISCEDNLCVIVTSLIDDDGNTTDLYSQLCPNNDDSNLNPGEILDCENYTLTEPGTCIDDASIAFAFIEKSIGENETYEIKVEAENSDELVSEEVEVSINVIAEYPVADPGINQTYVCGTEVTLFGMRSSDPQEEAVSFGLWETETSWDDETTSNVIAFYDENLGLMPLDGFTFNWIVPEDSTLTEEIVLSDINHVNPTFIIPCNNFTDVEELDESLLLNFDLIVTDVAYGFESKSISTTVTIVENEPPVAVIGKHRIYNEGDLEESYLYGHSSNPDQGEENPDTLRVHIGQTYTLFGENSFDDTPYTELSFKWTSPDNINLSDENIANPTFTAPTDLCSDGFSLTEKDCCNNNEGIWTANQECENEAGLDSDSDGNIDPPANYSWVSQSDLLLFSLTVYDGNLENDPYAESSTVEIPVYYGAYSEPDQPSLYARSESKKIFLYWDNLAEQSIDNLSRYADFQGYKIYRSTDYGETWGDAIYNDGEIVGWQPYAQYDLSAEQDSTYCLYKNSFSDCSKDSDGNSLPNNIATYRYDDISDYVSWYDGYYWQNLGSNTGLTQSFVDEDVIDGVDYTYSITAYDSGVRPDTLQYGHFGELSSLTSIWDPDVWNNNRALYTFTEYVEADSFYFYRMNYDILESFVENGKHMYKLAPPDEWTSGGIVDESDISSGVKIWETNTVWPISNPDEFPAMYSMETTIGKFDNDKNFVTIAPGVYASNVSFPKEEDLDEFVAADCKAIGDGGRFYEIVNESDLESGFVKLEIQANPGDNIFEGYLTENPCLYAYKVDLVSQLNSPITYQPFSSNLTNLIDDEDLYAELCLSDDEVNLNPGAVLNCDDYTLIEPDYLNISKNPDKECHELSFLDDPNYASNWSNFFDGVRMRFDNSLREVPKGTDGAVLKDVYSYPDSTIAQVLSEDDSFYGEIILKYAQNAFAKKPSYEYELELSESFIDTAFFNTTGGDINDFDHLEDCGSTFGTLLPFRVKNLTTGDYVKVSHSDNGIWNDEDTEIPSWFTTPQDNLTHPGSKDCVWSPGEWITFWDDVQVGESESTQEIKTFKLQFSFNQFMVANYKSDRCQNITDYDATVTYPLGSCVSSNGHVWYASSDVRPSDNDSQGFTPNEWYDDEDELTEINGNPWEIIYPWQDGDRIVIKPQKWFVDGDYWIADMSMLGATEEVTEDDISNVSVVPNPYIISSRFNESENGSRIRFTNLPQKCNINIYTISGEFVKSINHDDNFKGSSFWDLKNSAGRNVGPGLYIYKLETNNGLTKVGKFAVVR